MEKPLITNIQKYSIHDGEGTRTTVFFKGCPLSCKWCHNPETQSYKKRILFYAERCTGCTACVKVCMHDAISIKAGKAFTDAASCACCENCVDVCVNNAREICGKEYEIPELMKELLKDQMFYETSHGGVTLSGGEVLAGNLDYVENLMKRLRMRGILINVDTCGAVPWKSFERIMPYTDVFLYDIKLMDSEKHRSCTGRDNKEILENLTRLSECGAGIWIRIPVIGGVNDNEEEIKAIGEFLQDRSIRVDRVNLLPYHNTGSGKYGRVGMEYEGNDFYTPTEEAMRKLQSTLQNYINYPVLIGG
ncbi:MAG: glycyl-radical enzyme activating protein [Eubacteriales bacterium]|nr:glycyl-radical enzyme activating protein [Eubacteriales bacterium]